MDATERSGLVPYLFYDDIAAMLDWYTRVFGWQEIRRWEKDGAIENAEMQIGSTELWLDGGGAAQLERDGQPHTMWIGVWVDDPDAMYERALAAGVAADPPETKPYGVRVVNVLDPAGYQWGFLTRVD